MHTDFADQGNFKKPGELAFSRCTPGLKMLAEKLWQIGHKPPNLPKFSPTNDFCYTVHTQHYTVNLGVANQKYQVTTVS